MKFKKKLKLVKIQKLCDGRKNLKLIIVVYESIEKCKLGFSNE